MRIAIEKDGRIRTLIGLAVLSLAACTSTLPQVAQPAPPDAGAGVDADGAPPISGAADTLRLTLLSTTDVHGRLLAHDYYAGEPTGYGLSLLAPIVDSVRAANPGHVLLFDSGDLLQGNPLAYVAARVETERASAAGGDGTAGNPVMRAMNLLGYDAAAIGNHEFNYGLDYLRASLAQADFPFVSANVFRAGTDEHAFRPYALLPRATAAGDTLLVGVTGATPPGVMVWDRANVEGVLEVRDVVASVDRVVTEMRRRGADLVVVLSHGGFGGTSYDTIATGLAAENAAADLARSIPSIDVVFMGHTHREVADTTINGVRLAQAKNWATSMAAVELALERTAPNTFHVIDGSGRILRPDPGRADRALVDALRDWHDRTTAYVGSVVGRSTAPMTAARARIEDTPLIDFINEVQRQEAGADLASSAAFNLDARLPEGPVTIADVAAVYVYDNTLKAIRITGAQLRAYLEKSAEYYRQWPVAEGETVTNPDMPGYNFDIVSGVEYTLDISKPVGERVTELTYQGEPVRDEQTFTLALNNYRQGGGGGFTMLADAPVVYDEQREIRDLLIEELRREGTIDPAEYFEPNWRLVPGAAAEQAAREQNRSAAAAAGRELSAGTAAEVGIPGPALPGTARLRILALNDLHGRLLPDTFSWSDGRPVGGAAALAAYFDVQTRAFDGPTVILDGGDVFQGTPISNLTDGRASVEFYNVAGIDAAALGNHEFDWGQRTLGERIDQADFAWLAANIRVEGTDTAPSWIEPAVMLDVDGVRLGVIGVATEETPHDTRAVNVAGLEFDFGAEAVNRWVPMLRERGADFVVVIAHAGAFCERDAGECEGEIIDLARALTNRPDLMVGGHTHQVVETRVNGIPIIETGAYGTRYGMADLVRVAQDSVAVFVHGFPTTWADVLPPDSAAAALVEGYRAEVGPAVDRVVATLAQPLERDGDDYALGRLIADAQRWATHAQVALMNNGGIRGGLPAGPLTWGELYEVQPFENRLVRMQLTGSDLRNAIERRLSDEGPDLHISGLDVWYDPTAPDGRRILALEFADGSPLRDDGVYTVTTNNFMAFRYGDESMAAQALAVEETPILDLEALVSYLEQLADPVPVPEQPRFHAATPAIPAGGAS